MGAKRLRITSTLIALATSASVLTGLGAGTARAATPACASDGCWTAPFSPFGMFNARPPQTTAESRLFPAAASLVMMPNGRIVYWNGLQGAENCGQVTLIVNLGACGQNAHSEILDLTKKSPSFEMVPTNSGHSDLFCSDQRLLENGTVLDTGGTYYSTEEPKGGTGVDGAAGLVEVWGSKDTRLFSPTTKRWTVYTNAMHEGRWYPSLLTLPSGDQFVAGGVRKLLWNSSIMTQAEGAIGNPQYQQASAPVPENIQTNEIWKIDGTGWTLNPAKDNVELPLYGRLHLLPDGEIFYSGNGQMWGPAGESVNEVDWNNMKLFDPSKIGTSQDQGWQNAGMLQLGAMSGASSTLMPFDLRKKDALTNVHILVAGGVVGVSPDSLLATNMSQLITLTKTASSWSTSVALTTGQLNSRRWFSSSVLLPSGQVVVFNGADKDEVIEPGLERPVQQTELYDPTSQTWTPLAESGRGRTYHNTAILLPDGSVLVGGHAPLNQLNGGQGNSLPLDQLGFSHNLKDPSFERFYPPYLYAGPRPSILSSQKHATWGETLEVQKDPNSPASIDHFVLSRLPAQTHITDADARTIILNGTDQGSSIKLSIPKNRALTTPGFYYLFAMSKKGVPSQATIVQIADKKFFQGSGPATPVDLAQQGYRSASDNVKAAQLPVGLAKAAKKAASSQPVSAAAKIPLATEVVAQASKPIAPARATQPWLIVLTALMGAILVRRIRILARR